MLRWFILLVVLLAGGSSVMGVSLADGLYPTFLSFKEGKPIPVERIISSSPKGDMNFLKLEVERKYIQYRDDQDSVRQIRPSALFCYVSNGTLYLRHNDAFNRVSLPGSISHFTAVYTVYRDPYDPMQRNNPSNYSSTVEQYILDVEDGKIYFFNMTSMEHILKRDDGLYQEFMALKKSKRRKLLFVFLRKYNENHPWTGNRN
ncbi:MAG: hypothetical protein KDD36_12055 [Flavobacteriales bacterium]|nr:hypothetical protein [Flavobacteriales bacterium]